MAKLSYILLLLLTGCNRTQAPVGEVHFYKDVRPLILHNCMPCHAQGGSYHLPNFIQYDVAFKYRSQIKFKVWVTHTMPPNKQMSVENRKIFRDWVDQGARK